MQDTSRHRRWERESPRQMVSTRHSTELDILALRVATPRQLQLDQLSVRFTGSA
jgi:hypothetical protein